MSADEPIELGDTSSSEDEIEIIAENQNDSSRKAIEHAEGLIQEIEQNPTYQEILAENSVSSNDDDSVTFLHTRVDVDRRVNSNFDDVSVFEVSSSEEEEDGESVSSSELLQRNMPFRGDREFMLKTGKKARESVVDSLKVPQDYPTRVYLSVEQEAEAWKERENKRDDKCLRFVEEAAREISGSSRRQTTLQSKAKRLRDLQKKKRKQLKKVAKAARKMAIKDQRNKKEFPIYLSETPYHIFGDYLCDPCYQQSEDRVALIMTDENVAQYVDEHEEGWMSYKDGLQQYRAIPGYIVDQRIKETEEVVRLLQKHLGLPVQKYVRTYISILMRLSLQTVNTILKKVEKEKTRKEIIPSESLFCPQCQIYGCTIHGLVDVQNYSYRTAQEVAMRKEESGSWKQEVGNSKPLSCVPCHKRDTSSDTANALAHSQNALAKKVCFIYEGDLDKVSKILGASKETIRKAVRSEQAEFRIKYHFMKNVKKDKLQRFDGLKDNRKYFLNNQGYFHRTVEEDTDDKKGDEDRKKIVPEYVPCIHEGDCSMETCPCIENGHACTNHCILGPLSPNFFPGCACESKCMTHYCPCTLAGRECDPEFCKNCKTCTDPMGVPEERKQLCRNDYIRMRRQIKGLYYKKSTIQGANWGMFCNVDIKRGSYIGEYVGEYLSEKEVAKRKSNDENLAYLFSLPGAHSIDGIRQGNITRYMNHSDENPNVRAATWIVNGDPRIGFIARRNILANTEMVFDYGKNYKADFRKTKSKKKPAYA